MILISQYWGKRDAATINRILGIGLYLSTAITLLASLAVIFFPLFVYQLTTKDPVLAELAARYARIAAFSWVFNSITMMYISAQRSMGNTKLGMMVLILSMLLNTFLNWVMIFGKLGFPAMGIEGAALATLISRLIEFAVTLIYALRKSRFKLEWKLIQRPGVVILKDFIHYSLPVVVNETAWSFGTSLYTVIMGYMPDAVSGLAAYTITSTIERLLSSLYFGFGGATAIVVGNALGAGDRKAAQTAGTTMLVVTVLLGVVAGGLIALLSVTVVTPVLFPLFGATEETKRIGGMMLLLLAVVTPFRAFNFCNIVGVLRGGGDARAGAVIDVVTMYLFALPLAALSGLVFGAPVVTVYVMMNMDEFVKLFIGYWRFSQKKWLRDVTRAIE